jgi:hypothetical protein
MERIPSDAVISAPDSRRSAGATASILLLAAFGLACLTFGYRTCSAWTGTEAGFGGHWLFLLLVVGPFSGGMFCLHFAWRIFKARLQQ